MSTEDRIERPRLFYKRMAFEADDIRLAGNSTALRWISRWLVAG